jgi:hypothetical protein
VNYYYSLKERRFETAGLLGRRLQTAAPWKIFRTADQSRCQIKQVKAIRAAARFSYLLFLRVRCPNPFFGISVRSVATIP